MAKPSGNTPIASRHASVASTRSTTSAGFNGIRLTVKAGSAAKARAVLDPNGAEYRVLRSAGKVSFLIASPGGPEGRLAVTLGPAVRRSGADVVALWHHAELEN
jgi:hypothetical protein